MAGAISCSKGCNSLEGEKISDTERYRVLPFDGGVLSNRKKSSYFSVPIDFGWTRKIVTLDQSTGKSVHYQTPCNHQEISSLQDIQLFLQTTKSKLSSSQFIFDSHFNIYPLEQSCIKILNEDVCEGQENVQIPLVIDNSNEETNCHLPKFIYLRDRVVYEGDDNINLNNDFISGCQNCTDCTISTTISCHCRNLTHDAFLSNNPFLKVPHFTLKSLMYTGYESLSKELPNVHECGIYECNDNCSCSENMLRCKNRVTQEGIKGKFQVFWTIDKGWGLRTLHDLPSGFFVCLYSGEVMSEVLSDHLFANGRGNEYFVKLSLIEIVQEKIGFEEDVAEKLLDSDSEDDVISLSDLDLLPQSDQQNGMKRKSSVDDEDIPSKRIETDENDIPNNFDVVRYFSSQESQKTVNQKDESPTNEDSSCLFVIDAKERGNVGRFLNHSCNPNCQLQNVFRETHDPRFPILAFFTLSKVKAGEELTWDYKYSDEIFRCNCKADNCRR